MALSTRELFSPDEWSAISKELNLPPRQSQIVQRLIQGRTDKEIASSLNVSFSTVRSHLNRIFTRFKVEDRRDLILEFFIRYRAGRVTTPVINTDVNNPSAPTFSADNHAELKKAALSV